MIFIPRWQRFRDKKPAGFVEINDSNYFADKIAVAFIGGKRLNDEVFVGGARDGYFASVPVGSNDYIDLGVNAGCGIDCSIVMRAAIDSPSADNGLFGNVGYSSASNNEGVGIRLNSVNGKIELNTGNNSWSYATYTYSLTQSKFYDMCAVFDSDPLQRKLYIDQAQQSILTNNTKILSSFRDTSTVRIGRAYGSAFSGGSVGARVEYAYLLDAQLSEDELFDLSAAPYQILKSRRHWLVVPVGSAANLSASADAKTDAAGTISTEIALSGASITLSKATGALSIPSDLAGISASVSRGSGVVTANINLSVQALSRSLAQAGLDIAALMQAQADARSDATASLGVSAVLSGAGDARASAGANLTLQATLSGLALSHALGQANLGEGQSLSARADARSSASGGMVFDIPLSGSAKSFVRGAGSLSSIVPIAASAASMSQAVGGLNIAVELSTQALATALAQAGLTTDSLQSLTGDGTAVASADASLTLQIPLSATAVSAAVATAGLSVAGEFSPCSTQVFTEPARGTKNSYSGGYIRLDTVTALQLQIKRPDEFIPIDFIFTTLGENETIVAINSITQERRNIVSGSTDLGISNLNHDSGSKGQAWINLGTDQEYYCLTMSVTTSIGAIRQCSGVLLVKEAC